MDVEQRQVMKSGDGDVEVIVAEIQSSRKLRKSSTHHGNYNPSK
jgi:hypothetical protein